MSNFTQPTRNVVSSIKLDNDEQAIFGTNTESWFEYDTRGTISGLTGFVDSQGLILKQAGLSGTATSGTYTNGFGATLTLVNQTGNLFAQVYANGSSLYMESAKMIFLVPHPNAAGSKVVAIGNSSNNSTLQLYGNTATNNEIAFGANGGTGGNIMSTTNGSGMIISAPTSGGTFIFLNGAIEESKTNITGTYTALKTDHIIAFTAYTGGSSLNLPPVANVFSTANKVFMLTIKDEAGTANTNNITIDGSGTEAIDGNLTATINAAYGSIKLYTNGTAWFTI